MREAVIVSTARTPIGKAYQLQSPDPETAPVIRAGYYSERADFC